MADLDDKISGLKVARAKIINSINSLRSKLKRVEDAIAKLETVRDSQADPDFVAGLTAEFDEE